LVFLILQWLIIIRCFLSWIPHSPRNPLIKIVYDVTEPILRPFQKIRFGGSAAMIDFSPVFAIITMMLIRSFVLYPIFNFLFRIL